MPPRASTNFLTGLVQTFVEEGDSAFELFEEHRVAYRPETAPPLPANVGRRSAQRSRESTSEAAHERARDELWAELWIVALYIGIDQLYDAPDLNTWAEQVEAPSLVANALHEKYRNLQNTREQQVALVLRIRKVWGADFFRRSRLLRNPILLPQSPAHGFLTQLAKLSELQAFQDFCTIFPQWLVKYIPTTKTHIACSAAHQKGTRVVGKGDLSEYLIFITTNKHHHPDAIDACPQVGHISREHKRRKVSRADLPSPRSSTSPPPVESHRRASPLECVEEALEDLTDEDPIPIVTAPDEYSQSERSSSPEDQELGVSLVDFGGEEPNFDHNMIQEPSKARPSHSDHSASEGEDALSDRALQAAGAVPLQEHVRRRAVALTALTAAKTQTEVTKERKIEVEDNILRLLGIEGPCDNITSVLREAMSQVDSSLAGLQSTRAAVEQLRANLRNRPGVKDDNAFLVIWGLGHILEQDPPDYNNRVHELREQSVAMEKQWGLLKEADFGQQTANEKLTDARKAFAKANNDFEEYIRTATALYKSEDAIFLQRASKQL